MKKLTQRQKEIVDFVSEHTSEWGAPPTRQEICDHFGFRSPNAAQCHLRAIEDKGYITLHEGKKHRAIQRTRGLADGMATD